MNKTPLRELRGELNAKYNQVKKREEGLREEQQGGRNFSSTLLLTYSRAYKLSLLELLMSKKSIDLGDAITLSCITREKTPETKEARKQSHIFARKVAEDIYHILDHVAERDYAGYFSWQCRRLIRRANKEDLENFITTTHQVITTIDKEVIQKNRFGRFDMDDVYWDAEQGLPEKVDGLKTLLPLYKLCGAENISVNVKEN